MSAVAGFAEAQAAGGKRNRVYPGMPAWRPRCKCGCCPCCQDNARWDRIFEKFTDPGYYGVRVECASPLRDV